MLAIIFQMKKLMEILFHVEDREGVWRRWAEEADQGGHKIVTIDRTVNEVQFNPFPLAPYIPLLREIKDQAEICSRIKGHVQAKLGMHAVAGRLITHAHDIELTLHSLVLKEELRAQEKLMMQHKRFGEHLMPVALLIRSSQGVVGRHLCQDSH